MKLGQVYYKVLPVTAFLFGTWYFCLRILGNHLDYIPGDLGDARFINYLLEHGYRWMRGDIPHFWDAGFMYPFKNTIALSDNMLGTMPFYAAWRFLGFSPETAYQLWWICICALNYWCSYFVFKKWFNRPDLAAALSWIFAFTIFNLGHLNYMQMIIRFMVPVVFYAAYNMLRTPSVKYFFIYCFGIIWQIYCVFYTGIYLFYFSLLFMVVYYSISKKWSDLLYYFKRENIWHTSAVMAFSIFTLLLLVIPYMKISSIVGVVHFGDVKPNLPYFRSYIFPQESTVTWKFLVDLARPDTQAWWLHYMFPGAILFAALIIAPLILLYNKIKKINTPLILKSLIITSCLIVIFHVQTHNGFTLYRLLFYIPGFNSIRVLTRFMNVEIFILLILCAYALKNIHSKYIFIFLLLVFADNLFIPELPREQKAGLVLRKEKLQNEIGKYDLGHYKAIALIDSTQPAYVTNIDMMLVAQQAGLQTINGYSSYCPAQLVEFSKENTEKGLYKWMNHQGIDNDDILLLKLSSY